MVCSNMFLAYLEITVPNLVGLELICYVSNGICSFLFIPEKTKKLKTYILKFGTVISSSAKSLALAITFVRASLARSNQVVRFLALLAFMAFSGKELFKKCYKCEHLQS